MLAFMGVALLGAVVAAIVNAGAIGAGALGLGAGGWAGGLLLRSWEKAAQRPRLSRGWGLSFLPRALLLAAAFLWTRHLWAGRDLWILPGYLAGEGVWVALAVRRLRQFAKE
jgi:hypothetical protein